MKGQIFTYKRGARKIKGKIEGIEMLAPKSRFRWELETVTAA